MRQDTLSCESSGPSKVAAPRIKMLRTTTRIPTMPEYKPSGIEIWVQCRSRRLSHLPTARFSKPTLTSLLRKPRLPSWDLGITLTTAQPSLMTTTLTGCTPRSINQGQPGRLLLPRLPLPMTAVWTGSSSSEESTSRQGEKEWFHLMKSWTRDAEGTKATHTGCQAEGRTLGWHHVTKRWSVNTPPYQDGVQWIQLNTPCSPGLVITPDLPRPHRGTLSPCPTLTPTPSLLRLTLATHLASHTHVQVTLGALTLATTPTQALSREAPCGRTCPRLLPLHFADYGTTL